MIRTLQIVALTSIVLLAKPAASVSAAEPLKLDPVADETLIFEVELLGIGEDSKAAESKPASKEQP